MASTRTAEDVRHEVITSLAGSESEFNVDGIVDAIVSNYGLDSIDDIPSNAYWTIVENNAL
jgi:hypothetical protein